MPDVSRTVRNKAVYAEYLRALGAPDVAAWRAATASFFADDARINTVHPFNEAAGPEAHFDSLCAPLLAAFEGLHCRPYILMGGSFEGGDWVTSTGYLMGHFRAPFLGIRPTGKMAMLRYGAFHRMQAGQAVESFLFLDLPEFMIACGVWPITAPSGHTGHLPGPATGDGLLLDETDPLESAASARIVTDMLSKLNTPDEGWRPYWHPNMAWYGPAAFGSYLGIDRFAGFQRPFELCFEGWAGGSAGSGRTRHFTRFGEGAYTCSGGWPSLSGVSVRAFLDHQPTGRMTYMRVCDWWRRDGEMLMENWVFVDIPHVLLQFDCDVFASLTEAA